ncbi:MAG: PQQ-binding-like beta-propeller repeat protein [Treponema sp.]|nr:PQQ-binding-like beta-propeller repeat protein [Treponema sp.]
MKAILCALFFVFLPWGIFAQAEEAFTDTPLWRQAVGGAVIGRPIAQVESVVIATDGGNLLSFSSLGRPLWNFFARGRITPHISRSREGTSYLGRINGFLVAVNRSGRELWQVNLGSPLVSPVLIGWDGRIFAFTDRRIICLTASGYVLWSKTLEARSAIAPIRDAAGGVIMALENGTVMRFDPFGNVFDHSAESAPAAAASVTLEGQGHGILLLHADRRMELLCKTGLRDPVRGTINFPSAPVAAVGRNDRAAVLLQDGRVALVAPAEREILWISESHIRSGEIPARPGALDVDLIFDERGIYILTRTGAAGFLEDGRRLWFMRLSGAAGIPSFGDDGILYSGGADWILYAYRLEDHIRAQQRLLYGMMPEGSYGTGNPGQSSLSDYFFRFEERAIEARFGEIRRAVGTGSVGSREKEYKAWLMETAGSLLPFNSLPQIFPPRRPASQLPDIRHRIEAARLLGHIGSRETIPFLTHLFNHDPDALVRAAAAQAIGRIGVDPDGIALGAFSRAISPPSPIRDESVLTAVAEAIGALCRFSGPPLSAAGIRLLAILAGYYDMPRVQRQALAEIRSLGSSPGR